MKELLSKEDFVKYINKIKEMEDKWSDFYGLLNVWPGDDNLSLVSELISLLEFIMEDDVDKTYDSWISWYCWETNFGHNEKLNKIWYTKDSKEIEEVIDTPEKLYDLLIENIEERKNGRTDS